MQRIETDEPNAKTGERRKQTMVATSQSPARVMRNRRLSREWKTVTAMIQIYCRDQHGDALCPDCLDLTRYVALRLEHCRFGQEKPTCARCPVHCYQRDRREQIKAVMRYAGPRMLWEHPLLSLRHWLDGWFQNRAAAAFEKTKAASKEGTGRQKDGGKRMRHKFQSFLPASFA